MNFWSYRSICGPWTQPILAFDGPKTPAVVSSLPNPIRLDLELVPLAHQADEPVVRVTGRVDAVGRRQAEGHDRGGHVRVRVLAADGEARIPSRLSALNRSSSRNTLHDATELGYADLALTVLLHLQERTREDPRMEALDPPRSSLS